MIPPPAPPPIGMLTTAKRPPRAPHAADELLRRFDPRPLRARAKVAMPVWGSTLIAVLVVVALWRIPATVAGAELVQLVAVACGAIVALLGSGTIGATVEDSRIKPIIAAALSRAVDRSAAPAAELSSRDGADASARIAALEAQIEALRTGKEP